MLVKNSVRANGGIVVALFLTICARASRSSTQSPTANFTTSHVARIRHCAIALASWLFLGNFAATAFAQSTSHELPIGPNDFIAQTCSSNPRLSRAKINHSSSDVETDEVADFLIPDPNNEVVSYFSLAAITGHELKMQIASKALYVGRRGKIVKTIRETSYEGNPIAGLIAHTFTLGLFFITSPLDSAQQMIGCTDRQITGKSVDIGKSATTDQFEWRDTQIAHKLRITIFGVSHDLDAKTGSEKEGHVTAIDLRPFVVGASIDGLTKFTVECLSCELHENHRASQFTQKRKLVSMFHDFRPLQTELFEAKRRAEEEAALAAERRLKQEAAEREQEAAERARLEQLRQAEIALQRKREQEIMQQKRRLEEEQRREKEIREKKEQIFKL